MSVGLVILLGTPSVRAQQPAPTESVRRYAETLEAGTFIRVHLLKGGEVKGHFLQMTPDGVAVMPRTRIAVPARTIRFADIALIEKTSEGRSAGAKLLIGIAIGAAAWVAVEVVAVAMGKD